MRKVIGATPSAFYLSFPVIRQLTIWLAVIATTFGSLGLPVFLHTCRMMDRTTPVAGCSMCSTANDHEKYHKPGDNPCCKSTVVNQRTDTGTLARVDMPSLPVFVVAAFFTPTPQLLEQPQAIC